MATTAERLARIKRTAELYADGLSPDDIAKQCGVTRSTTYNDLAEARANPEILDHDSALHVREAFALAFRRLRELTRSTDPAVAGPAARGLSLTAVRFSKVTGLDAPDRVEVDAKVRSLPTAKQVAKVLDDWSE